MSAEMGGHAGSEGCTGTIRGEVREEESAELKSREQDEENAGKQTKEKIYTAEYRGKTEHILLTRSNMWAIRIRQTWRMDREHMGDH